MSNPRGVSPEECGGTSSRNHLNQASILGKMVRRKSGLRSTSFYITLKAWIPSGKPSTTPLDGGGEHIEKEGRWRALLLDAGAPLYISLNVRPRACPRSRSRGTRVRQSLSGLSSGQRMCSGRALLAASEFLVQSSISGALDLGPRRRSNR
ncbi:hypothetical protein LINPERPRIM_LOCUS8471 [Linum perenne]